MINLRLLPDRYCIYQFAEADEIPERIYQSDFYSVTRTLDEISVIANCMADFPEIKSNKGWIGFVVEGILDFSLVGILHDLTHLLKEAGISVFVVSTFNTDYLFVKEEAVESAVAAFRADGSIQVKLA